MNIRNAGTTKGKKMSKVFASNETEAYMAARAAYQLEVAAIKAARKAAAKPATKRAPQALYGDMAFMAAVNGITTDGTGRSTRKAARLAAAK